MTLCQKRKEKSVLNVTLENLFLVTFLEMMDKNLEFIDKYIENTDKRIQIIDK